MLCNCNSFNWANYNFYFYKNILFIECRTCKEVFVEDDFNETQINNLYWSKEEE